MTDEDENVYEVASLNGRVSLALSDLDAISRSNILHTLLSDNDFYDALENFSDRLDLKKPGKKATPEFLHSYIIDKILEKNIIELGPSDDSVTKELRASKWFNNEIKALLRAHGVPVKYRNIVSEYLVLGDVNYTSYLNYVTVSINETTGGLRLDLDPRITQKDLNEVLPKIFSFWDTHRNKPFKSRTNTARTAAELARLKKSKSYGEIAKDKKMDIVTVKKSIERIIKYRKELLGDIS